MIGSELRDIDLTQLKPLRDGVVLERVELPEDGLLAIPDIARKPLHRGRVLRVGPGKRTSDGTLRPTQVKVGDMVRYQSADVDSGTHVLIQEADILFVERS